MASLLMPVSATAPVSAPTTPRSFEVGADGQVRSMASPATTLMRRFPRRQPYRLLCDIEDLSTSVRSERDRLRIATALVRHLLAHSPWIVETCPQPDPSLGWGVHFLYDEPHYPFTVQTVSWLPGQSSPIHNHAAWSVVAILGDPQASGRERNRLWQRLDDGSRSGYGEVHPISEVVLQPGDIVGFTPDAIHDVCSVPASESSPRPTLTLNIYGETDFSQRYEFDPDQKTAVLF